MSNIIRLDKSGKYNILFFFFYCILIWLSLVCAMFKHCVGRSDPWMEEMMALCMYMGGWCDDEWVAHDDVVDLVSCESWICSYPRQTLPILSVSVLVVVFFYLRRWTYTSINSNGPSQSKHGKIILADKSYSLNIGWVKQHVHIISNPN